MSAFEKKMKNLREELKQTKCGYLMDDLIAQCQNYYISPDCFKTVYGDYGLELGEVNISRDNEFNECYKKAINAK